MNYHSNKWIQNRVKEHYKESLAYFSNNQIVGIFYQGSANYGLDYDKSDVDTKLIITPTLKNIALNKKPTSTTHIRDNEEHIDWKDIRLYMETFRKQNLNFLEILFTDYKIINPFYESEWSRLIQKREQIARMNPWRAVKSMKGIALEKYHAMEHPYPSKLDLIKKYGYDGKQVHHLLRVEDYLERYIAGEEYSKCLYPTTEKRERMMDYKLNQIPLEIARVEATKTIEHITEIADEFCNNSQDLEDQEIRDLLEDVSYNIIKKSITKEISK